jgi:hypothetical protein
MQALAERSSRRRAPAGRYDARLFEEWLHDRPSGGKRYLVQKLGPARTRVGGVSFEPRGARAGVGAATRA